MARKKEDNMSLEENLKKIDLTIEKLQSKEVSLEEAFHLYQEGIEYVKTCVEAIDLVEKKVLMLNQEGMPDELGE